MLPFVALHVGAGRHSRSNDEVMTRLCTEVAELTMNKLCCGKSCLDACEFAIKKLEDHPLTNAGTGSSLNWDGFVECDAAVMDGLTGLYGCVCAAPNIKNPASLAMKILLEQKSPTNQSLVSPIILSGSGALKKARMYPDIQTFDCWEPLYGSLTTHESIRKFHSNKEQVLRKNPHVNNDGCHDTVGVIVVDSALNITCAVSTGGISLKFPGRIGDTAIPGCGFWVNQYGPLDHFRIACCTTGTGEQLIYSNFAKSLSDYIFVRREEDRVEVFSKFLQDFCSSFNYSPSAGFICVIIESEKIGEFWYGFTTESMGIGYVSAAHKKAAGIVDRKLDGCKYRLFCCPF